MILLLKFLAANEVFTGIFGLAMVIGSIFLLAGDPKWGVVGYTLLIVGMILVSYIVNFDSSWTMANPVTGLLLAILSLILTFGVYLILDRFIFGVGEKLITTSAMGALLANRIVAYLINVVFGIPRG